MDGERCYLDKTRRSHAEAQVCLDLARRQCGGMDSGSILVRCTSNGVGPSPSPNPSPSRTAARHRAGRLARCYSSGGRRRPRRRAAVQSGGPGRGSYDLERAVRSQTVELADLKATACRGAVGLRDRSHAGAGFAKSATEACWSELRIDAGLPASLGLVVQALCSSTTSALGAAGVEQNVPHASMSLRRFSRASPRR